MKQRNDQAIISQCPLCKLNICKCGFKSQNIIKRKYFMQTYEQVCYRCGGAHSALLCTHEDQNILVQMKNIIEQAQLSQPISQDNIQESQETNENTLSPLFNINTSTNRPQCVNCGSQRHVTCQCYFQVQNELKHKMYLTRKQREDLQ
ncbi:Hypothetical_protein [Hexamita inflata]|uniref:Hypothetical_protein n=1 Tax=Hexamita inflata TaxID=28002 RepID=A0AA86QMB1_9EUKA|nr:Hypothetical protein HINF_LOCUS44483 [Hexamita inflata]